MPNLSYSYLFAKFLYLCSLFHSDRLKLSFLLALIVPLISSFKYRNIFVLGSLFSHFSIVVFWLSVFFRNFCDTAKHIFQSLRIKKLSLAFGLIFLLISFASSSILFNKLIGYSALNSASISDFLLLISIGFTVYSFRPSSLTLVFFQFFPFLIALLLLGGSRINMLIYFFMIYCCNSRKNFLSFVPLSFSIYLFIKGLFFIDSVFLYGYGFG